MNERIIKNGHELKEAVEYSNFFHDGFPKSAKLTSGSKFGQNRPGEKSKQYESNEERLLATDLWLSEEHGLLIEIDHHNYVWPDKPPGSQILLHLENVRNVVPLLSKWWVCRSTIMRPKIGESGLALAFTFDSYAENNSEKLQLETLLFEKLTVRQKNRKLQREDA